MFFAFFFLLMLNGAIGVLVWLAWQKIAVHLRDHPDGARALAEHIVAPLLMGKRPKADNPPPVPLTIDDRTIEQRP